MKIRSLLYIGVAGIFASPSVLTAQGTSAAPESAKAADDGVGEIVVTARRREESLLNVPLSIVAKSGEELQRSHVDSLRELERAAPGLIIRENTGGANASVSIRGIGTTSADSNAIDPSIGTVIDGVVVERVGAALADFNDIDRVEVLRGPQGTLFGKNSSGGLVSIITKDPTDEFAVDGQVEYGSYDLIRAHAAVSGPIAGDVLKARISAYVSKRDGYLLNIPDGRKLNDDEQKGIRAKLLFEPSDETKVKLTLYGVDRFQELGTPNARSFGPLTTQVEIDTQGDIVGLHNDRFNGRGRSTSKDRVRGANLQWNQSLGDYTLISITGFQDWKWDYSPGLMPFQTNFLTPPIIERNETRFHQSQWSEELRIESPAGETIDFVAGGYLFWQKFRTFLDQRFHSIIVPNVFEIGIYNLSRNETETLNYAAFGEVNVHVLDTVTLTGGARWSHEKKDLFVDAAPPPPSTPTALNVGLFSSAAPGISTDSVSVSKLSWRFGARWEPTSDQMFYATASRGFKGAGFNTNSGIAGVSQQVDPEIATSYEIGWKASLLDKRLSTSLALFRTTVEDFQAQSRATITLPNGTNISNFILLNAGKLRSQGVEFELQAVPVRNLTLGLSGTYIDAKFVRFPGSPCYTGQPAPGCSFVVGPTTDGTQDLSGERLPGVPKYSANANAKYDFPISSSLDGFVTVDFSWRSSVQWSSLFAPFAKEGDTGLLGASIGIRDADGRYGVTLYGKNLTNNFHTNGINGGLGTVSHDLQPTYQRTWGIVLNYHF